MGRWVVGGGWWVIKKTKSCFVVRMRVGWDGMGWDGRSLDTE